MHPQLIPGLLSGLLTIAVAVLGVRYELAGRDPHLDPGRERSPHASSWFLYAFLFAFILTVALLLLGALAISFHDVFEGVREAKATD